MLRRFREPLPSGWINASLRLHRAWYGRRAWQWRARAVLLALVLCVIGVVIGLPKWVLGLSILGALLPVPVRRSASLTEIEARYGAAYTTALVAPEDPHGFKARLQHQAENVVFKAELPPLPWLEVGIALAFVALPFVLSLSPGNPGQSARPVTPDEFRSPSPPAPSRSAAPVALDGSQAPNVPRGEASSVPGRAAGSGTLTERQVGQVAPGGGKSADAPEQLDREFLDALERGAIRTTEGSNLSRNGKVENRDRSGSGNDSNGQKSGSGQGDPRQNAQGNGPNAQNQNGQRRSTQNRNPQGQNAQGSQGQNAQSAPRVDRQPGGNDPGAPNSQDPSNQFNRGVDRGQDAQNNPFDPNNPNRDASPNAPGQPGRGGRNASGGADAAQSTAAQGKLEYLPGQARGDQRRSGALQLPGDPRRGLSATPGSPEYRRAVESAILDPRLPPEYREMLKNYYR